MLLPLKFARAADLIKQLETAFSKSKTAKGPDAGLPIFNADARTNSIVVVTRQEDLSAIESLLDTLDVEAYSPERPVRIYRLQNTQADKIMPILDELLKGIQDRAAGQQSAPARRARPAFRRAAPPPPSRRARTYRSSPTRRTTPSSSSPPRTTSSGSATWSRSSTSAGRRCS